MPSRPSHKTRAEERADEIDISPTKLLADIEALTGERGRRDGRRPTSTSTALQRERAEFLNFKRRTAEERQRDLGLAAEDLIRKVLAARRRLRPGHRAAARRDRGGPVVRGRQRHRPQAAQPCSRARA